VLLPALQLALPQRGGGKALDAAASRHAPVGSGGGVPLVRGQRHDGVLGHAVGCAARQSPELHDLGLPDLLLQLPRQLARVHAVADHQQQVLAGTGHRLDP
jgi:hypothetical protein